MKNIATNTLSYTGIVSLSQYVGNKKIKIAQIYNTGGSSLFEFLSNCLIGNFDQARINYPTKIKLLNREPQDDQDDTYNYSSVSGFIFMRNTSVPDVNSGKCQVRYSFMIPRDLLDNVTNLSTLGLGLYAHGASESEPEKFTAFCALNSLDISRSELTNATLLVDWDLIISNNSATSSKN